MGKIHNPSIPRNFLRPIYTVPPTTLPKESEGTVAYTPQNRGFGGGLLVLIFVNFRPNVLKKKSQLLECIPDIEKNFHDRRIFYAFRIFYRKKFFHDFPPKTVFFEDGFLVSIFVSFCTIVLKKNLKYLNAFLI